MNLPVRTVALAAALFVALSFAAEARGGRSGSHHSGSHSHGTRHSSRSHSHAYPGSENHHKAAGVQRDSHGRIKRSDRAKDQFKHSHPCPSTGRSYGACPGYVIDHVRPLKEGGADAPSNMQWQTTEDAKEKDKWE